MPYRIVPNLNSMKTIFFFLCSFFFLSANAQCNKDGALTGMISGGNHNFKMVGDESNAFIDSLFANLPETKRKGYTWKFKNVKVPGVAEPLTIDVRQGVYGVMQKKSINSCSGTSSYFHVYTSEKYKQERLNVRKGTEKDGVIVYLRRGRQFGLSDKEEVELVKAYLLAIYE